MYDTNIFLTYHMSLTRQIAHNTIAQMIGKLIPLSWACCLGLMTRYLRTEQFGWYTTAISFLQFLGILIDLALSP